MKKRMLKIGVPLLLVAVLITVGVYPITSQAAAKGTSYKVVLQNGSFTANMFSANDGAAASVPQGDVAGISFTMVVEGKSKTEKLKSTGGKAEYYPVTILAKSFKGKPEERAMADGSGTAITVTQMAKDSKGKLYISGGDVDVVAVQGEKKLTYKLGDGKADPKGSLFVELQMASIVTNKATGKLMQNVLLPQLVTTGTASITVQGAKGGLNGKKIPDNMKGLSNPLAGKVIDLDAGTGTLVGVAAMMNVKNLTLGQPIDAMVASNWVMQISK
jgi:hypothetical protein